MIIKKIYFKILTYLCGKVNDDMAKRMILWSILDNGKDKSVTIYKTNEKNEEYNYFCIDFKKNIGI